MQFGHKEVPVEQSQRWRALKQRKHPEVLIASHVGLNVSSRVTWLELDDQDFFERNVFSQKCSDA